MQDCPKSQIRSGSFTSLCFGGLSAALHRGLLSYEQRRESSRYDGNLLTSLHDKAYNVVKTAIAYEKTLN